MIAKVFCVRPNRNGEWIVREEQSGETVATFRSKREAVGAGREFATHDASALRIAGRSGRVESERIFGLQIGSAAEKSES